MELRAKIEEWKKSVQVTPEMERQAAELERQWNEDPRWNYQGTKTTRPYSAIDVIIYRHVEPVESSVAKVTSQKLWKRLTTEPYLFTFGTASGAMTRAMVEAGARVIYVSGWVLAALRGYPDLSLYARSVMVHFVNDIVKNLQRHEDVMKLAGKDVSEGLTPLVVDMETGGGNPLVTYEYAAELIRVGAAAVHLEDQ